MKSIILFLFAFAIHCQASCQKVSNAKIDALIKIIKQSEKYDEEKIIRIEEFNNPTRNAGTHDHFETYQKLYEEYSLFRSDSAYWYARKMQEKALMLNDPALIAYSRM